MEISIQTESPFQPEIEQFIKELNSGLLAATPEEYCFHMTPDQLADESCTLLVARNAEAQAMGMGALKRHGAQPRSPNSLEQVKMAEIKRMYTSPNFLRKGVAKAILNQLEVLARSEGIELLVLETGAGHEFYTAAFGLYESSGFVKRGCFLDYPDDGYSTFYEKNLLN